MQFWILTLHGPGGVLGRSESPEAQFVLGSADAIDVLRISGEGVAPRHAWVWITAGRMQVEDLAGGTLVNGHPVEGRVEVESPASVQAGAVTLVRIDGNIVGTTPDSGKARKANSAKAALMTRSDCQSRQISLNTGINPVASGAVA